MAMLEGHERPINHCKVEMPKVAHGELNGLARATGTLRGKIIIIEGMAFLRECLERSVASSWGIEVSSFPNVAGWLANSAQCPGSLIILSTVNLTEAEQDRELSLLAAADHAVPTIILSGKSNLDEAIHAIGLGARGYIPTSSGFDVAMEAMYFVRAGGTYVPVECLLTAQLTKTQPSTHMSNGTFTSRELGVIQAIRKGKSNKLIAYDLCMCEITVKVHVRHIMKKLGARNRTEVAIRSTELLNVGA